ncbi:MAG: hypothetical protein PVF50_06900, partial [Gammaproteobacteria bacterium]
MIPGKFKQLVNHDPGVWRQRRRIIAAHRWLLTGVMVLAIVLAASAQDEREELDAVRERIGELEARIEAEVSRMDADRQALRRIELRIAEQNQVLEKVRRERDAEQATLAELNRKVAASRVE